MVTKSRRDQKKGRVKVGKLKLNKETVKSLNASNQKGIRGGLAAPDETKDLGGWFGVCIEKTQTCLIVSVCGRCR